MTSRPGASSVAPFAWSVVLSSAVAIIALWAFPLPDAHVPPAVEGSRAAVVDDEPVTFEVLLPLPDAAPVVLTFRAELPMPRPRVEPSLLELARRHLGTNPTGWARLWCGRFMEMIAPKAARRVSNPHLARSWATLPRSTPQVGAIVVLTRGRDPNAGHIGVVSGFDRRGNPRVVSGNHNRRVAESVYPKSRVVAYVTAASS